MNLRSNVVKQSPPLTRDNTIANLKNTIANLKDVINKMNKEIESLKERNARLNDALEKEKSDNTIIVQNLVQENKKLKNVITILKNDDNIMEEEFLKRKKNTQEKITINKTFNEFIKNSVIKTFSYNMVNGSFFKNNYINSFNKEYNLFVQNFVNKYKFSDDNINTSKEYNNEKGIISLTTWKKRINYVAKTLYNLYVQCPDFHIVLVLSEEEFPNKGKDLPKSVLYFSCNKMIEILWVKRNYKAYKKVLFTMNKYKNVPVISADDDCLYLYNYAESFYIEWCNNPKAFISCWDRNLYGINHCAGAATLYPPNVFGNTGIKCLSKSILDLTGQDDDYYTELKLLLSLKEYKKVGSAGNTYIFHDEEEPLKKEIKTIDKDVLHKELRKEINKNNKKILVSLTSYPKRISNVHTTLTLLLNKQTLPPDEIHLWLSVEEFPNKEKDLPNNLTNLLKSENRIKIHWLEKNTYVHKRHEIFKITDDNSYVFFIDDDVEYNSNLINEVVFCAGVYKNNIILYNGYSNHIYKGRRIIYEPSSKTIKRKSLVNQFRWCGQSMIPSWVYPKECLSEENVKIRNKMSPVSDECWFQPWVVLNDIPLYACEFGWGKDISKDNGKSTGLVSWTHQKDPNGFEKRDNWLYDVLNSYPNILKKYEKLFNYGKN